MPVDNENRLDVEDERGGALNELLKKFIPQKITPKEVMK